MATDTTPAPTDEEIVVVPSDTDIEFLFEKTTGHLFVQHRVDFLAFARAVLAKWGAQAASPAPVVARYRLLERGRDKIQAGDEFLRDDGVTWRTDPSGIFVGCTYEGSILRPARRAIEAAHGITEGAS